MTETATALDETAREMNAGRPAFDATKAADKLDALRMPADRPSKEAAELPDGFSLAVADKTATEPPGPPLLTEAARRKEGFQAGTPIVLSDGVAWYFPKPVLTGFSFAHSADGSDRLAGETSFGGDYDALVDAFIDAPPGPAESVALYRVAHFLLTLNYGVTNADTRKLLKLAVRDGSPAALANGQMWQAIADHILSKAPGG